MRNVNVARTKYVLHSLTVEWVGCISTSRSAIKPLPALAMCGVKHCSALHFLCVNFSHYHFAFIFVSFFFSFVNWICFLQSINQTSYSCLELCELEKKKEKKVYLNWMRHLFGVALKCGGIYRRIMLPDTRAWFNYQRKWPDASPQCTN